MKWAILFWVWQNSSGNWEKNLIGISQQGRGTLEQRLDSEERNNAKEHNCDSNSYVSE